MVNKWRGEAEIELANGDLKIIRYDLNAVAELEEQLDKPLSKIFSDGTAGIRTIIIALTVGLRNKGNRKITPKLVGDMIDPTKIEAYGEAIGRCITLAMGGEVDEEEGSEDPLEEEPAAEAVPAA